MKITLAFLPEEKEAADAGVTALRQLYPGLKVRESTAHPPFMHFYMTSHQPAKPCRDKENA